MSSPTITSVPEMQFPWQSNPSSGNSQVSLLKFAVESKLHANASMQPAIPQEPTTNDCSKPFVKV